MSVSVPVRLDAGDEMGSDCVAADVYFGDDKLSESAVVTTLLPGGQAERTVRVTTSTLVNEPVVTVFMAVGCKAKITRKFVAFADPPGMLTLPSQGVGATPSVSAAAPGTPPTSPARASSDLGGEAGAAPGTQARQPAAKSSATSSRRAAASKAPGNTAAARSGSGSARASAKAPAAQPAQVKAAAQGESLSAKLDNRPRVPAETSRLELDPADQEILTTPSLTMSSALGGVATDPDAPEARERRAAAAALWAAMNATPEQLARDRQRLQELEQRFARLQQESSGARDKVAAMEARVQVAEDQRLNHPVVWGLAGLCLLLLGGLAWLFTSQRRQEKEDATWWQGQASEGAPEAAAAALAEPPLDRTSAEFMPVRGVEPSAGGNEALAASAAAAAVPEDSAPAPAPAPTSTTTTRPVLLRSEEAVREITVEELIDLEQQAEFFVVLGQDDAAIELLESHVQTTAGASPLPYLKLLEIYQRLDKREDYESVRTAFNSRFNAYAPSWESDLQQGHALEDYPGVVDRLQSLWSQPAKAMEVLQVSLTRADGSEETFDLPAYRELLFLYAVARDLSERESQDRAPVDLLLPVQDHERDVDDPRDPTLQPLMATRPVRALPEASPSLSLDLSLDDPVPSGADGYVDNPGQSKGPQAGKVDDNSIDFDPIDLPLGPKR